MRTYQDLIEVVENENEVQLMQFLRTVIDQYKADDLYRTAVVADKYNRHLNVTISNYQKLLYKVTGEVVPDNYSANFKMACRHFHRFVTQENQFLLGNGSMWENDDTPDRLGTARKPFDTQLQKLGKWALICGVSFGFFNVDHIEVFNALEFAPLFDEEDGALKAGVRFWQIDKDKPLRATLYELDGYTDFIWKDGEGSVYKEKEAYKLKIRTSDIDGSEIYAKENYPTFPIVPLWANEERQSELVGLREQIDCYDLIKSGFANTVDESSLIYWTINNAGGMDDIDLAKFVKKIKEVHAAVVDDEGASAQSHQIEAPYESREALLNRLNKDLYRDAMALDTENIAGGAITATQIQAAYEPLNSKVDGFEYCVREFVDDILNLAGIDDNVTFTRSMIVNTQEDVQTVISAAQFLSEDYVARKILALLGDADQADEILKNKDEETMVAYRDIGGAPNETEESQEEEENS